MVDEEYLIHVMQSPGRLGIVDSGHLRTFIAKIR